MVTEYGMSKIPELRTSIDERSRSITGDGRKMVQKNFD